MFDVTVAAIEGYSQIALAAGEQTEPLDAGVYAVWSGAEATYIRVDQSDATDATALNGYLVPAGIIVNIRIGRNGMHLGSSGECHIHRIG